MMFYVTMPCSRLWAFASEPNRDPSSWAAGISSWVEEERQIYNGNPLRYSCLENPMDRGVWQDTVHGVARVGHDLASKPPPPSEQDEAKGTESLVGADRSSKGGKSGRNHQTLTLEPRLQRGKGLVRYVSGRESLVQRSRCVWEPAARSLQLGSMSWVWMLGRR